MQIQIKRNGHTASMITVVQCNGDYEIKYIKTELAFRGQGLASQLLEKAKSRFPVLVAFLDDDGTGLTVEQMEAWYKRHGFKKRRYELGVPWDSNIKTVMYWAE